MYERNLSKRTVSRKISCLRSFYKFLVREGVVRENPFALVTLPKKEQKLPRFFYEDELKTLFSSLNKETPMGLRDAALLEVLYATGIRISECCDIKITRCGFFIRYDFSAWEREKRPICSIRSICTCCTA